jgi:hypothetical protein
MRIYAVFALLHPEFVEGVEGYNANYNVPTYLNSINIS